MNNCSFIAKKETGEIDRTCQLSKRGRHLQACFSEKSNLAQFAHYIYQITITRFMKRLFYTAAVLSILLSACKHQQNTTTTSSSTSSTTQTGTSPAGGTAETNTSTSTTTTTTTGSTGTGGTSTTVTAGDNGNTTTTVTAPVDSSRIYRVTVSFISKGEGVDYKTLEDFENWLKNQPKTPAYVKTHWGREGETNFCLKLNELSTREQEIFVRDLRTKLTDKDLVLIAEYAECKGRPE